MILSYLDTSVIVRGMARCFHSGEEMGFGEYGGLEWMFLPQNYLKCNVQICRF